MNHTPIRSVCTWLARRKIPWRFSVAVIFLVALLGCTAAATVETAGEPGETGAIALNQTSTIPSVDPAETLSSSLPRTLARVRIAFDGNEITDALADLRQGVIYVSASNTQLHVLDIDTFVEIITLPVGGQLTLDADNNRLYAASDLGVAVIDTSSRTILTTLPGTHLAIDSLHRRLYVGESLQVDTADDSPGVRLYDSDTLDLLATGDQPGIPVYNPLRDELLLVSYTLYTADAETLAITDDLLPELSEQSAPWCNGCDLVQHATIFPDADLLAMEIMPQSVSGGPGPVPPLQFWTASTLTPDEAATAIRSLQPLCGERRTLRPLVDGLAYRSEIFQRYVTLTNLSVYDESGALLDWRDGLQAGFVNANTAQAYTPDGAHQLRALDLATLQPVDHLPIACVLEHDAESGRIYGAQGGDFYILAESGGENAPLEPIDEPLPVEPVQEMVAASAGAEAEALFAILSGNIYRSLDGGETWSQLRGGLPTPEASDNSAGELTWTLALSPDFANDKTLFVGGHRGTAWGEGVWHSEDAGESWQPAWQGLQHLRIDDVALSPRFAQDNSLVAYARYDLLNAGEAGFSAFRSTDRGLSWSLVSTATVASDLPPAAALFSISRSASGIGTQSDTPPVRVDPTGRGLERTLDGATWQPVDVPGLLSQDSYVQAILQAQDALYVVAEYEVLRTLDEGTAWERWIDPRVEGLEYTNRMTSALWTDEHLIIGKADGQIWTLTPRSMTWQPVE